MRLMGLQDVHVPPVAPQRLEAVIGPERAAAYEAIAAATKELLTDRTVMNVNSTASGGGVAELLQTLLANVGGFGIDTQWVVIEGNPDFFTITKRLHNHLYGALGDGGPLGEAEHEHYVATLVPNAVELLSRLRPDDVVLLHDPQTAGMAPVLHAAGISVVWRCHVGIDRQNEHSLLAWEFLRRYLDDVPAFVFSTEQFPPPWMDRDRVFVIPPSINPFSAKNEEIGPAEVLHTLAHVGLLEGPAEQAAVTFSRRDGTSGRVHRPADLADTGPPPAVDVPVVLQASRWDTLKDMSGVMTSFAENLADMGEAHLVLAGPSVDSVADDPEAAAVLASCLTQWRALPAATRSRIHLACVSIDDGDEAAAVVNALQRHATVVTQKSLAEGFGLTVTEAMWKGRPVVGSAVGGIVTQIVPGETGVLLDDPHDLDTFGAALAGLLADPQEANRLGRNGRQYANEHFLGDRHLTQWGHVLAALG
jgi:trehalose synthase